MRESTFTNAICKAESKQISKDFAYCEDALGRAENAIGNLPSAQPEKRTEKRMETHACDCIERQAAIKALPSAQPNLDEWCTDCKEYDHEKHCCPRFNRVIRDTLNEVEPMRKRGTWMHDKDDVLISGYCSCCGWESIIMETDVADMPFCPNCGADMRGEGS